MAINISLWFSHEDNLLFFFFRFKIPWNSWERVSFPEASGMSFWHVPVAVVWQRFMCSWVGVLHAHTRSFNGPHSINERFWMQRSIRVNTLLSETAETSQSLLVQCSVWLFYAHVYFVFVVLARLARKKISITSLSNSRHMPSYFCTLCLLLVYIHVHIESFGRIKNTLSIYKWVSMLLEWMLCAGDCHSDKDAKRTLQTLLAFSQICNLLRMLVTKHEIYLKLTLSRSCSQRWKCANMTRRCYVLKYTLSKGSPP